MTAPGRRHVVSAALAVALAAGIGGSAVAERQQRPAAAAPAAPEFTELEQAKIRENLLRRDNAQLQIELLTRQVRDLDTDRAAFLSRWEAEHPGWTVNPKTFAIAAVERPAAPPKK